MQNDVQFDTNTFGAHLKSELKKVEKLAAEITTTLRAKHFVFFNEAATVDFSTKL